MTGEDRGVGGRGRQWLAALLLFALAVAVYCANGRVVGAGDTLPARYLPLSLLREGDVDLDEFPFLYGPEVRRAMPILDGIPYFLRFRDGHYLSAYSPAPALMALPVYLAPVLGGLDAGSPWVARLEKLSAALLTALSVVFLFLALTPLVACRWALGIAAIYAFGTSSLSVSSQALWEHGPSQCWLALALCLLVRSLSDDRVLPAAAFALATAAVLRATNVPLVLPVAAFILYRHRRRRPWVLLAMLPPLAGALAYSLRHLGATVGAGHVSVPLRAYFTQTPLWEGVLGVLLSPGRGLFVYSPVLLFAVVGIARIWRSGPALFRALSLGPVLVVLVVGKWFMWWGGYTYGPRLLADITPVLCFLLYPLATLLERRRRILAAFLLAAAISVGIHALGALAWDGRWDAQADVDRFPARLWSWVDGPIAFYGREWLAGVERRPSPRADGGPTSAGAASLLAARYAAEALPTEVVPDQPFVVSLTATNSGRARWLALTPDYHGMVRLAWRWLADDRVVLEGRASLPHDVTPGDTVTFRTPIRAPATPGAFILSLELVSEFVTWFADQGSSPVRRAVTVEQVAVSRLVDARLDGAGRLPRVTVATDRPVYARGDVLHLTVDLVNPGGPGNFDAYLVLRGASGKARLFDGLRLDAEGGLPWPAWVKGLPLPALVKGRFALPVTDLDPGRYTWHAVLTEPGRPRPLARAGASFDVQP